MNISYYLKGNYDSRKCYGELWYNMPRTQHVKGQLLVIYYATCKCLHVCVGQYVWNCVFVCMCVFAYYSACLYRMCVCVCCSCGGGCMYIYTCIYKHVNASPLTTPHSSPSLKTPLPPFPLPSLFPLLYYSSREPASTPHPHTHTYLLMPLSYLNEIFKK